MSFTLVSISDVGRARVETLIARAEELSNGASPNLRSARVGLALSNTAFPLPLAVEETLRGAGAEPVPLPSPDRVGGSDASVILFSSPQTDSAHETAARAGVSFLNAGDGAHENPVRALMDAYAIRMLKGDLRNLRVALLGNLKFSAEAHSLARLLGMFEGKLSFVTTAALSMPYDLTDEVRLQAYEVEETNDLTTTLLKTDALYLSRIDPIRVDPKIYDKQKNFYTLNPETFAQAKEGLVILGEWDGAEEILAATRPQVERAARAMLLALVETAI